MSSNDVKPYTDEDLKNIRAQINRIGQAVIRSREDIGRMMMEDTEIMRHVEEYQKLVKARPVFNDALDSIPEPWGSLARKIASATWHDGRAHGLIEATNNEGSGVSWLVSALPKKSPYEREAHNVPDHAA